MPNLPRRACLRRDVMAVVALCAPPLPAAAQRVVISYCPVPFTPPLIQSWNLDTGRLEWQRDDETLRRPVIPWALRSAPCPSAVP